MSDFWHAAAGWAAQTAVAGAVVLGIGWVWLRRIDQPARRQRLAGWTVRAAVLVAVLSLMPGWLKVPVPAWARPTVAAVHGSPANAPADDASLPQAADAATDEVAANRTVRIAPVYAAASGPVTGGFRTPVPAGQSLALPKPADEVIDQPWDVANVAPPPDLPVDAFLAVAQFEEEPSERAEQVAAPPPAAPRDRVGEVAPLVLLPYAAIAAAGLLQLAAGQYALARMRRTSMPAPAWLQSMFDDLAFGIPFGPRLLVSATVLGPVCFGLFRPTVLLPRRLVASATREQLRWVVAHELDHLRRGDSWTGVWVSVARAIYFFVPWFWAVRRELALSQEYLADAAAAAAGGQPVDYAAFLVDLSARPGESRPVRHPLGAAGVRAGKSDLFRRVTMLLNAKAGLERKVPRGWSVLSAGGVLTAAVLLSGVTWAADDEPKKVIVVEAKQAGDKKVEGEVTVEIVVADDDDQKADEKRKVEQRTIEVKRVDAKQIAALKKAVEDAARKGDLDAVREAVNKLEKAVAASGPRAVVIDGKIAPVPPVPPVPGARFTPAVPGVFALRAAGDEAVKELEKAIEGLKKAAEQVKDQPEAKAALEKSIAEFRKKIDEAKKKGELVKPALAPAFPVPPAQFQFDWAANKDKITEQLKKALEMNLAEHAKQLELLKDNPEAREALKQAAEQSKKALQEALKGLEGAEGAWQIAPQAFQGQGRAWIAPAAGARGVRLGVVPEAVPEALAEQLDLPKGQGVLLSSVIKGTPAEKAGFKANDILIVIGGKDIEGGEGTLTRVLAGLKSGESIDAVVIRKGKKVTIKGVKLAEPEKPQPRAVEVRPSKPAPPTKPARPVETPDSGAKSKFNSTTVRVSDGEFNIRAVGDEVRYTITGKIEDGKPMPSSIAIRGSDNKTQEYGSLEKVPADHRAAVKQLLGSIGGTR